MTRLTDGQRRALIFAATIVVAGMAMGFASSFATLSDAARAHGWQWPWLLPASVDSGILAYVLLDHLAVTLGSRSRLLHLIAWALAAFTVWANGAAGTGESGAWRVIHAAMPALWVLGVEALRFMWRRLHGDSDAAPDRIPVGRWLASPLPTLLLWRRMRLLGVTSWPMMCAMEDARVFLRDSVRAVRSRRDVPVPLAVRRAIRTGRFPGEVSERIRSSLSYGGAATWEPSMESWLASRLGLSQTLAEALSNDRQEPPAASPQTAPEPAPESVPEVPVQAASPATPKTPRQTTPRRTSRPSPSAVKRMTPGDLAPHVGTLLESSPGLTPSDLMKSLHVGREKATEALRLAKRDRLQAVAK